MCHIVQNNERIYKRHTCLERTRPPSYHRGLFAILVSRKISHVTILCIHHHIYIYRRHWTSTITVTMWRAAFANVFVYKWLLLLCYTFVCKNKKNIYFTKKLRGRDTWIRDKGAHCDIYVNKLRATNPSRYVCDNVIKRKPIRL